ncbi:CACO2 protein, partial [Todus mexicanus]|nr:CACO2 protein [Todus mexicanus]
IPCQGEVEELELQNKNLRQENEELKATCAGLQKQTVDLQEELKRTQELQNSLESLRSNAEMLELELNSLKKENEHLKELDDCRAAELCQLKEQIQKVTSEKEHLETRLKTALEHVDQLQSQVLNYEKEVENLSQMDRAKTEQLESLKEENRQLRVATTQQKERNKELEHYVENAEGSEAKFCASFCLQNEQQQTQDLRKELEEQKRLFQILQAKKNEADEENQKLREENDGLLQHLSQASKVSSVSFASPAPVPAPEAGGLLFGNPYCGELTWHSACDRKHMAASLRKCPMCDEVFSEYIDTSQYEAHVHSHLLECPLCRETFEKSDKQVYDDHLFCHRLE